MFISRIYAGNIHESSCNLKSKSLERFRKGWLISTSDRGELNASGSSVSGGTDVQCRS